MTLDVEKIHHALANRKTLTQRKAEAMEEGVELDPILEQNPLLSDVRLTGFEDDMARRLIVAGHLLRKSGNATLRPLLPLLLQLKGRPYHLQDHFPFSPFFRTRMAKATLLKTGRQVSKSTSLASQGVLFSQCIPYFSTLYITPLFEMIRRFSQNYVRPFIETSPAMKLFSGSTTINSVLQRSFKNRSQMLFSFACLDAERTRGISADKNVVDEVQHMDMSFLPIIHETMSGSVDWGIKQYAGTPLTLDNTIEKLWQDTSMAEWVIKCPHGGCGHWNVPAMEYDLVEMIGPYDDFISEKRPGVVCAKCQKPINPRTGRWVHRRKSLRWDFAGYHVPQIIMPMHYASAEKWGVLLGKQKGAGNTPIHVFFNEVLGESFDSGSKLVNLTQLKRASCLPWENRIEEAEKKIGEYVYRVMAVDWGGGGLKVVGKKETTMSFTCMACLGMRADGKIDVIWGLRSLSPHDRIREAELILKAAIRFKCHHITHDYTGQGADRELMLVQAGYPLGRIVPIALAPSTSSFLIQHRPATELNPRSYWQLNKSRSLQITCQMVKSGFLRFFQYDHHGSDNPGLINDFLALVEETSDSRTGRDIYVIHRDPNNPDDFAQAVNLGVMALCQISGKWPELALAENITMEREDYEAINPALIRDWDDM